MYTAVLMLAMVSAGETANHCGRGCYGGYGGCYSSCYAGYRCYGGYGCYGCYGGYRGCYGGCYTSCYGGCYGGGYYCGGYAAINYGAFGYAAPIYASGYVMPQAVVQNSGTTVRQSMYADPAAATMRVLLPNGDAQVWFDDSATRQTGMERTFFSPPLQNAGKYTIRATWSENGNNISRQKTVNVQPGQSVTIDFRQAIADLP